MKQLTRTLHPTNFHKRLASLLVAEVFFLTSIFPAWAVPLPTPSHLRPHASDGANQRNLLRELQQKQVETARDGGSVEQIQVHFRREKERLLEHYQKWPEGVVFAEAYASLIIQTVKDISEIHLQGPRGIAVMVGGSVAARSVSALSDLDLFIVRDESIDSNTFQSVKNRIIEDLKGAGIEMDMILSETIEELVNVMDLGNVVYINEAKEALFITGDESSYRRLKEEAENRARKREFIASDFTYHLVYRMHTFQVYSDPRSPNLKYSLGGKRSLFDIYRILTRVYGIEEGPIGNVLDHAVKRKYISPQEKDEILNAYNFIISLENEIVRKKNPALRSEETMLQHFTEISGNIKRIWDHVMEDAYQELKRQKGETWARQMDEIRSSDLPPSRHRELFLSAEDDGIRYAILKRTEDATLLREASQEERWLLLAAIASNIHTPANVLDQLSQRIVRGFEDVNLFVARNPSTLPATLQRILDNPEMLPAIQSAARANLQRKGENPEAARDGGRKNGIKAQKQFFDQRISRTFKGIAHAELREALRLLLQPFIHRGPVRNYQEPDYQKALDIVEKSIPRLTEHQRSRLSYLLSYVTAGYSTTTGELYYPKTVFQRTHRILNKEAEGRVPSYFQIPTQTPMTIGQLRHVGRITDTLDNVFLRGGFAKFLVWVQLKPAEFDEQTNQKTYHRLIRELRKALGLTEEIPEHVLESDMAALKGTYGEKVGYGLAVLLEDIYELEKDRAQLGREPLLRHRKQRAAVILSRVDLIKQRMMEGEEANDGGRKAAARDGSAQHWDKTPYEIAQETTRPLRDLINQMGRELSDILKGDNEHFAEVKSRLKGITGQMTDEVVRLGRLSEVSTTAAAYSALREAVEKFTSYIDTFITIQEPTAIQERLAKDDLDGLSENIRQLEDHLIVMHLAKIIRQETRGRKKLGIGGEWEFEGRIGLPKEEDFDQPLLMSNDHKKAELVAAALRVVGYKVAKGEWVLTADDSGERARDGGARKREVLYGIPITPFSQTISSWEKILELSP